jgi:peptidoglycan/LPS O-acetylase OafA/YrhL
MNQHPGERRLVFLDALRGVLALVVVGVHVALSYGSRAMVIPGLFAVLGFFTMSGYVLARSYTGRPALFVLQRVVRLWPLYASCIFAGYALLGRLPPLPELAWWPVPAWGSAPVADYPAWSLYYEAWATPFFPVFFVIAKRSRAAGWASTLAVGLAGLWDIRLGLCAFFVLGITLAQYRIRLPSHVPKALHGIGVISYSLYLTHQLVISVVEPIGGANAVAASLPLMLFVAWVAWRLIELPSISMSRAIKRRTADRENAVFV